MLPSDPQDILDAMLDPETTPEQLAELREMASEQADEPDDDPHPADPEATGRVRAWIIKKAQESQS